MNIDPLTELADDLTPYHYANNNPIIYIDPDGLSAEKSSTTFETVYKDTKGNVILDTDDGSEDIVVVPDAKLNDFKELVKYTDANIYNSKEWNDHFKSEFLGIKNPNEMNALLNRFTTQWSRQNAINYLQNSTGANAMMMAFSEALSQWTDPQQVLAAASVLAFKPSANGVVYLREDLTATLKPYVGQAKNEARYLARQAEHARANPDSHFRFTVIDKGSANGSFPTSLDMKEQKALNKLGGPTNKTNPKGGASNRKNVIRQ